MTSHESLLDFVSMPIVCGLFPLVELRQGVEALRRAALGDLDNGRDELLQEGELQEGRPVVVDEVDEQALDVGPVLVLIGHDHELAIPRGDMNQDSCIVISDSQTPF